MENKCCFKVYGGCTILRVTSCSSKCKFYKTKEEFEEGAKKADERLRQLGLVSVVRQVPGGDNIITVEREHASTWWRRNGNENENS